MADKTAKDTTRKTSAKRNETTPPTPASDAQVEGTPATGGEETRQNALNSTPPAEASGAATDSATDSTSGEQKQQGGEVFEIAVLPLQQTTLFPGTVIPLSAGRPRSVSSVESALSTEEKLLA